MKYIAYGEKNITEEERIQNNKKYIEYKLKTEKYFLDTMFKKIDKNIKLDDEQKRIILTDEKHLLVIAGAGSGKTTTISAKVNYLIKKQNIKSEEILVISFTNKAVQELKERINKDFNHNVNITTFHKFAYEIIKSNTKTKPKIIGNERQIIKKYIEKEFKNDKQKLKQFIKLYPEYFNMNNELKKHLKHQLKIFLKKIKKIILKQKNIQNLNNNNNKTLENIEYEKFIDLCVTFINHLKSKEINETGLKKINQDKYREKVFFKFISNIYEQYQKELSSTNQIDFNEMINSANEIVKNNKNLNIKYKYIIIDEYQDISESRYNLIKNITSKMNNKTMVVGDDWQCIYSFASSNINLFTNYKNNVDYCEVLKITKTYRNSQELIDIAGKFIQKNQYQIKKNLISNKTRSNPVTILKYRQSKLKLSLLKAIEYIIKKYGENKNILILGRYTFDIKKIIDNINLKEMNNRIIYEKHKTVKLDFMTIHSAKGLGYDNVILINAINDKLGFPSKIKNDPLLEKIMTEEKNIEYAEERRLFYVALTRTKNEIIILTPKKNPSEFVMEIKKYKNVKTKKVI